MQQLWEDEGTEALILIDARNAFNEMCRAEALQTAGSRCVLLSPTLRNIYGHPSELRLADGSCILSEEGTTQGCPLGMAMFAISSVPLIEKVTTDGVHQSWYADDAAGAGKLDRLHVWFSRLTEEGPRYGYHTKFEKTVALVKPEFLQKFRETFKAELEKGLKFVSEDADNEREQGLDLGQRYLGVGIGSKAFREEFVRKRVNEWTTTIENLGVVGELFPHNAYATLTHSIIPRWRFVMRTMPVDPVLYAPLEKALINSFFRRALGWAPDSEEGLRTRCALPPRLGGLGLPRPEDLARQELSASAGGSLALADAVLRQDWDYKEDSKMIQRARDSRLAEKHTQDLETAKRELKRLTGRARRGLEEAIEDDHSSWLSAVPLEHLALDLNRQVFRDAVALKMGQDLPDPLPQYCPDCGEDFDISHALTCKKGAWIVRRHHEVKAAWRALFREVSDQVDDEPVLPPAVMAAITKKSTTTDPGARGDIRVRGLFQVQQDAYTDVVVVDTGCPSNVGKGAMTVLRAAETRKHSMYDERVRPYGAFAALASSVYGTLGPEASKILALVTKGLDAERQEKAHKITMHRVNLQIATVKAVSMSLRSRSPAAVFAKAQLPESLHDSEVAVLDAGLRERLAPRGS